MEPTLGPEDRVVGAEQMRWLKQALAESAATWKVIASDMPIGLIVWNDAQAKTGSEGIANAEHSEAKGREIEFAELLSFIKHARILNVVWLTADVHYTAAHHYDPNSAVFQDFEPFWEFVSGPIHAGTFGPGELDRTFGPEARFVKAPTAGQPQNLPPSEGLQFFGVVEIDGASELMIVRLMDRDDTELFSQTLEPRRMG